MTATTGRADARTLPEEPTPADRIDRSGKIGAAGLLRAEFNRRGDEWARRARECVLALLKVVANDEEETR